MFLDTKRVKKGLLQREFSVPDNVEGIFSPTHYGIDIDFATAPVV